MQQPRKDASDAQKAANEIPVHQNPEPRSPLFWISQMAFEMAASWTANR